MDLQEMRDDYDWKEASNSAGGPDWDHVAEVLAADEGQNDGDNWIAVFRMDDGRFGYLTAWCDYTGWGCQDGGDWTVRDDLRTLVLNDIGEDERERLGFDNDGNRKGGGEC